MADWKKIKKEYIAGGVSYKALAEKLQQAREDKKAKILATDKEINQRYK